MIQCARLAFGFVGVFDQDEAERITEKDITPTADLLPMSSRTEAVKAKLRGKQPAAIDAETGEIHQPEPPAVDPDDEFLKGLEKGE